MSEKEKNRYSSEELQEFEALITAKLTKAKQELSYIKSSITGSNNFGSEGNSGSVKVLEDGADTMEKESMNQLAARQQKFIANLENALIRIKTGTYGICSSTGKLISKERLRAVPHTTQSIEAKLAQDS